MLGNRDTSNPPAKGDQSPRGRFRSAADRADTGSATTYGERTVGAIGTDRSRFASVTAALVASAPCCSHAAEHDDGRWHPAIGDPDVAGWLLVVSYLLTAVLAVRNARTARGNRTATAFWLVLAGCLCFLGINKQLEFQTLLTEIGRDTALAHGWYDERRGVQAVFVLLLTASAGGALLVLRRLFRGPEWSAYRLTVAGVTILMLFIVLRAATFHHVAAMFGMDFTSTATRFALEFGALLVIAAGCIYWLRRYPFRAPGSGA